MTEFGFENKQGDGMMSLDERLRKAREGMVVTMPEEVTLAEQIAVAEFQRDNPDLTLESSGWAGCRVTFYRAEDGNRTSVDLAILPENYCGEREGFSLTVDERQMAYEELESRGVSVEGYVIEKAEMFKEVWIKDKEKEMPDFKEIVRDAKRRAAERNGDPEVKRQFGIER